MKQEYFEILLEEMWAKFEWLKCGEKIYDRHAMQKIEMFSPAFDKSRPKKTPQKPRKAHINSKSPALAK